MSEKNASSSVQDSKAKAVQHFMDLLRLMAHLEIGDNPDEIEMKEAVLVCQYIQKITFDAFKTWREYRRFPIYQLTFYGDHQGRTLCQPEMSPSRTIQEMWRLKDLTRILMEATEKWDGLLQDTGNELPDLKMGKIKVDDMVAYSAIKEMIKNNMDEK